MKRLFLATIMLLLSSYWASTQSSSPSSQQQPDKSQTAAADHKKQQSVVGCLSGAANTFTLTDAAGKTYELIGDTSGLNANVGHKVRISGNLDTTGGGERISASGQQALIEVKNVESLSDKCK